ncbi:uncharacterized protein LOC112689649 isoform X2 [Sipha flava]|nr:uncharacterized protein LOC112689649 isoform X2 [Sipha flava]
MSAAEPRESAVPLSYVSSPPSSSSSFSSSSSSFSSSSSSLSPSRSLSSASAAAAAAAAAATTAAAAAVATSAVATVTSQLERAPFGHDGTEQQTNTPGGRQQQHCPWCKRASGAALPSPSSSLPSSPPNSGTNRHHHRRKHRPRGRRHYDNATRSSLDKQRIEAIKEQILSKLGMAAKPNITKARSTRFLVEALAVEPLSGLTAADPDAATGNTLPPSTRLPSVRDTDSEPDDFYGRTKEIIGFAEPGSTLNGQTLLEFPWSQDMGSTDSVKVKSAKLWFRLEYRPDVPPVARRTHHSHNVTLWLFKINFRTNQMRNTTFLSGVRRARHAGFVAVAVAEQPRLDIGGRDEHGARVVRLQRQAPAAVPHRLFRLRRPGVARAVPRHPAGERVGEPVPDGVHGPDGDETRTPPRARLLAGHARPVLQAAVLHQVPGDRMGLVDNRAWRLLRQLLPRRLRRCAQDTGHVPQLEHAGDRGLPEGQALVHISAVLRARQVLVHVAHLLHRRRQHHQTGPAQNGHRRVRLPVSTTRIVPASLRWSRSRFSFIIIIFFFTLFSSDPFPPPLLLTTLATVPDPIIPDKRSPPPPTTQHHASPVTD